MSFPLSSVNALPLSSVFKSETLQFVNNDREVRYEESTNFSNDIDLSYPEFTEKIRNLNFKDSYFTFVTDFSNLSGYINTLKVIQNQYYGYNMNEFNVKYDWIYNNFTQTYSSNNNTQFLGIVDHELNFNILPLKTKTSINNESYSVDQNYKEYQKIYDMDGSVFIQFKIDKIPFQINPDEYSLLFNSYGVASCHINDADFINNGAVGGNCPLNSDIIFFDRNEYGAYTNNGPSNVNAVNNGTLLCLWLSSASVDPLSNKVWMERWYDPNTVTQGGAFITQTNTVSSSFTFVTDVPSNKILMEKEKLTYLRYGPDRNETFVNNLSSDLQIHFKDWNQTFSSEVNGISGFVVGEFVNNPNSFVLRGTNHGHVPPEDALFTKTDFTVSLWAYADDWSINNDSQFFGNYHDGAGYGIFYNTGTPNNLISIPTKSNNLFALNNKGYKVFEKDLRQDLGLSAISIDYIKTDVFGNRWLFDSHNTSLYKIENDDLVIKTIDLPATADITKIECNADNDIFILDNFSHTISSFDSFGNYLTSTAIAAYQDNFDIDLNGNIIVDAAEFLTVNSQNKVVKMIGPTLYIDNNRILHLTDKPQSLRVDLEDNVWILFNNRIIKVDTAGTIIFDTPLTVPFSATSAEMGFVKIDKVLGEAVQLWIIFNEGRYVIALDDTGKIVRRVDLTKLFVGRYCASFDLNIVGDFTGFDNRRKFEQFNGRTITPSSPVFTARVGLLCGNDRVNVSLHAPTVQADGWTHFTLDVKNRQNQTIITFYLNGKKYAQRILNGNYKVDHNYMSSPFIIGGTSGKLGAKNLEKSIMRNGFFVGEIDDIRIYNRSLNAFEIFNLALNNHYTGWGPISFYIKSPEITMIEEIDTFHINRYKGFKSNHFNVIIRNFSGNETLRDLVRTYINENISMFIPANTVLNEIKFE